MSRACVLRIAVFAVVLTSCANVSKATRQEDLFAKQARPAPGAGLVYLFRDQVIGAGMKMSATYDGQLAGQTGPNTFLTWQAFPGWHQVGSVAENTAMLPLLVEPGRTYFVWQEVKMGVFTARTALHLLSEAEGRRRVAQCVLVQSERTFMPSPPTTPAPPPQMALPPPVPVTTPAALPVAFAAQVSADLPGSVDLPSAPPSAPPIVNPAPTETVPQGANGWPAPPPPMAAPPVQPLPPPYPSYPPQPAAFPVLALQPEPPPLEVFGAAGQVVLTGAFVFNVANEDRSSSMILRPQVDFFVTRLLTLGGELEFSRWEGKPAGPKYNDLSVGFTMGLNLPMGDRFSVWPRLLNRRSFADTGANSLATSLIVPFLFHPAPHFFIGMGPFVSARRYDDQESDINIASGVDTLIGGWW